ncbi:MAG TPA: putative porin [Solimonas sp.]
MMKKALFLALATAVGSGSALAQDYQWDASLGYTDFENDSALSAGITYHLDRVKTAGHPLAEAAFLERSSNLSLGYVTFDDADADAIGVAGEFYFDQLYLSGGYTAAEIGGVDVDTISARIGWMLADGFRLAAGIDRVDADVPNVDARNDIAIEAKYVTKMEGGTALNLQASVTLLDDPIDDELFEVRGDYYFNPAFSVGAGVSIADDDTNYGIGARYFFTPTFSGGLLYETANDGDDDVISAALTLRF